MEYISRHEYFLVLNDIKKFDLEYFVYLFVLLDMQENTKILEKINFDLFFIKETNRLLIKNISNLKYLFDRTELINNLIYLLQKNKNMNNITYKEWYSFTGLYLNMFYKTLIKYYIKNKLVTSNTYILKLWSVIINTLYSQLIS